MCDLDQLAICRLVNGQAHAECFTVPPAIRNASQSELEQWCLDKITRKGLYRLPAGDPSLVLQSGHLSIPSMGVEITFRTPHFSSPNSRVTDDSDGGGGDGGLEKDMAAIA
ncbi:hypothetical protein [Pseudomonas sp. NPDC096950]|uniref:hypothetical protein n=1 Tax=Pseudomonas sp. NPDC096950 TaxID=3364485 RepID=UPI00383AD8C0